MLQNSNHRRSDGDEWWYGCSWEVELSTNLPIEGPQSARSQIPKEASLPTRTADEDCPDCSCQSTVRSSQLCTSATYFNGINTTTVPLTDHRIRCLKEKRHENFFSQPLVSISAFRWLRIEDCARCWGRSARRRWTTCRDWPAKAVWILTRASIFGGYISESRAAKVVQSVVGAGRGASHACVRERFYKRRPALLGRRVADSHDIWLRVSQLLLTLLIEIWLIHHNFRSIYASDSRYCCQPCIHFHSHAHSSIIVIQYM